MNTEQELNSLPSYMYCDAPDCYQRHYLILNKDIQGKWTIGYSAFTSEGELGIAGLCINGNNTVAEAVLRIKEALGDGGDGGVSVGG